MMEVFADGNGGFVVGMTATAAAAAGGSGLPGAISGEYFEGVFCQLAIFFTCFVIQNLASRTKKIRASWNPRQLIMNPIEK